MKSAALPFLVKYNPFGEPTDAVQRYFEAQCEILGDRQDELLAQIEAATGDQMLEMATLLLNDAFVQTAYPRVTLPGILALWEALGEETFFAIAKTFLADPYRFRAGWPDLTLIRDTSVRFVEVKTTDMLRESQITIVENFARPMSLDFRVCHVEPGPTQNLTIGANDHSKDDG